MACKFLQGDPGVEIVDEKTDQSKFPSNSGVSANPVDTYHLSGLCPNSFSTLLTELDRMFAIFFGVSKSAIPESNALEMSQKSLHSLLVHRRSVDHN